MFTLSILAAASLTVQTISAGLTGLKIKDIAVRKDHNGKPDIILHETALEAFMDIGGKNIHLSLSHEEEAAVAVVLIEG